MTHNRLENVTVSRPRARKHLAYVTIAVLSCLPFSSVLATEFELARLTAQIYRLSSQLANELRYTRGYGTVRLQVDRLSREAEQLTNVISRNRSHSYIRSEFKDILRRYHSLEDAFLRANRSRHDPRLFQHVSQLSNIYSSLSDEFYYTNYPEPLPPAYVYNSPIRSNRAVPPAFGGRGSTQQRQSSRKRDRRDYGRISASRGVDYLRRGSVADRQ